MLGSQRYQDKRYQDKGYQDNTDENKNSPETQPNQPYYECVEAKSTLPVPVRQEVSLTRFQRVVEEEGGGVPQAPLILAPQGAFEPPQGGTRVVGGCGVGGESRSREVGSSGVC